MTLTSLSPFPYIESQKWEKKLSTDCAALQQPLHVFAHYFHFKSQNVVFHFHFNHLRCDIHRKLSHVVTSYIFLKYIMSHYDCYMVSFIYDSLCRLYWAFSTPDCILLYIFFILSVLLLKAMIITFNFKFLAL